MNTLKKLAIGSLAAAAALAMAPQAYAANIRIKCETRGDHRSKISVDADNVASGNYSARVVSGGAKVTSPIQATVGDEVEFDFDSNANDIADGATAVSPTFIQSHTVTAKILDSTGHSVASDTEACRAR